MKIIAVVNDNTGEIYAIRKGYGGSFFVPLSEWIPADEIQEVSHYGEFGEFYNVAIKWDNFKQIVSNRNYSFIYEEEEE